ncbi:MAG TPA: hypothetical protein VNZ25_05615 [Candidatus Angelobacter sp.]|nr:hypothetical protein [Candidatus Angelobacter sp.]
MIADTESKFAFLGPEDDGLAIHPSHHVKGCLGLAAQGQFQKVLLDTGFDGFAEL